MLSRRRCLLQFRKNYKLWRDYLLNLRKWGTRNSWGICGFLKGNSYYLGTWSSWPYQNSYFQQVFLYSIKRVRFKCFYTNRAWKTPVSKRIFMDREVYIWKCQVWRLVSKYIELLQVLDPFHTLISNTMNDKQKCRSHCKDFSTDVMC